MARPQLAEHERQAFCQEITSNNSLGYFYHFDNVPLSYVYRDDLIEGALTELEKRNRSIVEEAWVESCNSRLDEKVFHADRFRMQLPNQKCSFNFEIAQEAMAIERQVAPDREIALYMTYAKGNQVIAEGVVSWTEDGIPRDSPFISFLLLDEDGLIIRERRYHTMSNWPGAKEVSRRLGL